MSGVIEGRAMILTAVMAHRWEHASSLQRLGHGTPFAWVFVVPVGIDRPEWMPRSAVAHTLSHGEVAYTWTPKAAPTP